MKTAIIVHTGFDGGGSSKLGYEFHKLGLDVYFRNKVQLNQIRPLTEYNTYKTVKELISILSSYDKVIFSLLAVSKKDVKNEFETFILGIKKSLPDLKICYLNCARKLTNFYELLDICKEYDFEFDHIYSIVKQTETSLSNYTYLNINAYTFRDNVVEEQNRLPYILSAGRIEGLKGTLRYIEYVDNIRLSDDFYYIHEGANFSFSNNDINVPLQFIRLFDRSKHPKVPFDNYTFKNYGELPEKHKVTLYPSYSPEYIINWAKYHAGVCCILGSLSKTRLNLFDNSSWYCDNKRENTTLHKQLDFWDNCMEYTNIEMIDVGLPVFISRAYSIILGFEDDRLIYDSFPDISKKAYDLNNYWEDARNSQRNWLISKQDKINSNIVKTFQESV